jgi:hypothetical protein
MIESFYKDNPQNKKMQGEFKKKPKKKKKTSYETTCPKKRLTQNLP